MASHNSILMHFRLLKSPVLLPFPQFALVPSLDSFLWSLQGLRLKSCVSSHATGDKEHSLTEVVVVVNTSWHAPRMDVLSVPILWPPIFSFFLDLLKRYSDHYSFTYAISSISCAKFIFINTWMRSSGALPRDRYMYRNSWA